MRLIKDESEINLANGEAEQEFDEWKWASPEEVIEQVCPDTLIEKINLTMILVCRTWKLMG